MLFYAIIFYYILFYFVWFDLILYDVMLFILYFIIFYYIIFYCSHNNEIEQETATKIALYAKGIGIMSSNINSAIVTSNDKIMKLCYKWLNPRTT